MTEPRDGYFKLVISTTRPVRKRGFMESSRQIRSNDTLLNSEPVLQAYLNGFEYHRDKDTQAFIHGLHEMLPLDFSKVLFEGLLLEKARAIFSLADLIAVTVGKTKEIGFKFFVPDKDKGLPGV